MTGSEWRAHAKPQTPYYSLHMLSWAWRRPIVTAGMPRLVGLVGQRWDDMGLRLVIEYNESD